MTAQRLDEDRARRPRREPDLFYLAAAHQGRMKRTYVDGPADLVVEIIAPESA